MASGVPTAACESFEESPVLAQEALWLPLVTGMSGDDGHGGFGQGNQVVYRITPFEVRLQSAASFAKPQGGFELRRGAAWPTKGGKGFTLIEDSGARYVLLPPTAEQSGDVGGAP